MNWKQNFLESYVLGQSINKTDPSEVKLKCISLAYRDMMTAGKYYSKSFIYSKEDIYLKVSRIIEDNDYNFSRDLISKVSFLICNGSIGKGNKYVTGYGLAQKLVNMTFKYLYVFSHLIFVNCPLPDFSLCDCPLDSTILKKANIQNIIWSKLTEEQYIRCQIKIKNILKSELSDSELSKLGNLAFDFISW